MIAEIHGKISSKGTNLSDRQEDQLTGDIFGSLRYLPFDFGIGPILSAARIPELSVMIAAGGPHPYKISFWPSHPNGELDVRIDLDDSVIGIEVKYESPLSSEDDADYSDICDKEVEKDSINQLSRESRIVREFAGSNRKAFLILVASDKDCVNIFHDVTRRKLIDDSVPLGYISWQEILLILEGVRSDDPLHTCVLKDMTDLLKRKDFDRFHNFGGPMGVIQPDEYFPFKPIWEMQFPKKPLIDGGGYYEFK